MNYFWESENPASECDGKSEFLGAYHQQVRGWLQGNPDSKVQWANMGPTHEPCYQRRYTFFKFP